MCLPSSLSGVHSRKNSKWRRQSMEGTFSVGWTCPARGGGRCPRVGSTQLLQDTPPVTAAGAGGQEARKSQGVRIPPILSKMRAPQGKASQRERHILLSNVQISGRQRLGKENSGTKSETCLSELRSRQSLGSDRGIPAPNLVLSLSLGAGRSSSDPQPLQRHQLWSPRSLNRRVCCTECLTGWCDSPSCDTTLILSARGILK